MTYVPPTPSERRAKIAALLHQLADKLDSLPEFVRVEHVYCDSQGVVSINWDDFERLFSKAEFSRDQYRDRMTTTTDDGAIRWDATRWRNDQIANERREIELPGGLLDAPPAAHAACEVEAPANA